MALLSVCLSVCLSVMLRSLNQSSSTSSWRCVIAFSGTKDLFEIANWAPSNDQNRLQIGIIIIRLVKVIWYLWNSTTSLDIYYRRLTWSRRSIIRDDSSPFLLIEWTVSIDSIPITIPVRELCMTFSFFATAEETPGSNRPSTQVDHDKYYLSTILPITNHPKRVRVTWSFWILGPLSRLRNEWKTRKPCCRRELTHDEVHLHRKLAPDRRGT